MIPMMDGQPMVGPRYKDVEIHADDFWIYKNGARIRKYFSSPTHLGIKRYWRGHEWRVNDIENLRQKLIAKSNERWESITLAMDGFGVRSGDVVVKCKQPFEERYGDVIYYHLSFSAAKKRHSYSPFFEDGIEGTERRDAVKRLPTVESDAFHLSTVYHDSLCARISKVSKYLDNAIRARLDRKDLFLGRIYRFSINNHDYWYVGQIVSSPFGGDKRLELVSLSWPDSDTVQIVLNQNP